MSRSNRRWFHGAAPVLLGAAILIGALGPVSGVSGQVVATPLVTASPVVTVTSPATQAGTATPVVVVADTPATSLLTGTASVVASLPAISATFTVTRDVSAVVTNVSTWTVTPAAVATGSGDPWMTPAPIVTGTMTPAPIAIGQFLPTTPTGTPGVPGGPLGGVSPEPKQVAAVAGTVQSRDGVSTLFTSLSAGLNHTCGLTLLGVALCWGSNYVGQIGDGSTGEGTSTADRLRPAAVGGNMSWVGLAAGGYHSCGLSVTRATLCWGANWAGELGNGISGSGSSNANQSNPVTVVGDRVFATLVSGGYHTCGLDLEGYAYCWGYNTSGQLGDGTTSERSSPTAVGGLRKYAKIAAGDRHTCALSINGTAYCWGSNSAGQLGNGTSGDGSIAADSSISTQITGSFKFSSLTAGGMHTCGLTSVGAAYCWGANDSGQLGNSFTAPWSAPNAVSGGVAFASLTAGGSHTCGLTAGGTAFCWGANRGGQVGDGTESSRTAPVAVSGSVRFTSLVAGGSHTCGLDSGSIAYCWGWNGNGQLGDGTSSNRSAPIGVDVSAIQIIVSPTATKTPTSSPTSSPTASQSVPAFGKPFVMLVAGHHHNCALDTTGRAYCWGWNSHGQGGQGSIDSPLARPVLVASDKPFVSLTAGFYHTCGLTKSGSAYCWGRNTDGQLGTGTSGWENVLATPELVSGGLIFTSLTGGFYHSCGLVSDGTAFCWGHNGYGQLGDGASNSPGGSPRAVAGDKHFSSLVAGDQHTCGLTLGGAAYCWGANLYGQLGDGLTTQRSLPAEVLNGLAFTRLSAGGSHTCGLTAIGTAYCWGRNEWGQLGDGTKNNRMAPVMVSGGHSFTNLAVGHYHTCGLDNLGYAFCWGSNAYGQRGDLGGSDSTAPLMVSGRRTFTSIVGGDSHTCALDSGLVAYCWGANWYGQLGNGSTNWEASPAPLDVGAIALPASTPTAASTPNAVVFPTHFPNTSSTSIATATGANSTIRMMQETNVRDTSFTIIWTTNSAVTGFLKWGVSGNEPVRVAYDPRGSLSVSTVHSVTVNDLQPSTQYAFDIVAGNTVFTNSGYHFDVTTGPTIPVTAPDLAAGRVTLVSNKAPGGALVRLNASNSTGGSATISALVTASDSSTWVLDLGSLRTPDLSRSYPTSGDTTVTIEAFGGFTGEANSTVTVSDARNSLPTLTLNFDEVLLANGWNLVSLQGSPIQPLSAEEVCVSLNRAQPGAAVELDRWEAGGWEGHVCGVPPNDFVLEPMRGYFIRVNRPVTWAYDADPIRVAGTRALSVGWNLVGIATPVTSGLTVAQTCTTIDAKYGAGTAVEFAQWRSGGWEGHRCGLPPNNFTLVDGNGYFVRIARPAIWTPTLTDRGTFDLSKLVAIPGQPVMGSPASLLSTRSQSSSSVTRETPSTATVSVTSGTAAGGVGSPAITGRGAVHALVSTFVVRFPGNVVGNYKAMACRFTFSNTGARPIDFLPSTSGFTPLVGPDGLPNPLFSDPQNGAQLQITVDGATRYLGPIDVTLRDTPPTMERLQPNSSTVVEVEIYLPSEAPSSIKAEVVQFNLDFTVSRF